jgi:hypothetical protein
VDCEEFSDLLNDYFDEVLTPDQQFKLDFHRKDCEKCRRVFRDALDVMLCFRGYFGITPREGEFTRTIINLKTDEGFSFSQDERLRWAPWAGARLIIATYRPSQDEEQAFYFAYIRTWLRTQELDPEDFRRGIIKVTLRTHDGRKSATAELTAHQPQAEFIGDFLPLIKDNNLTIEIAFTE